MNQQQFDIGYVKREIEQNDKELTELGNFKFWLTDWIFHRTTGEFTNVDIDRDFDLKTKEQKKIRGMCIKSLIIDETISPAGKRHGTYKIRNKNLKKMDFRKENTNPVPISLPFGIHKLVNLFKGNIIQINGEKNSGKTALVLNIIKDNMDVFNVSYFNSEMGGAELKRRLLLNTDVPFESWDFDAYERAGDFHEVVQPGEDMINIIDFLEQHEDFWLMGKHMRDIHDNLNESIGIVCVQLNKGADQGLGGGRTEEKPRLILNVSPGRIKIKMAKNWATAQNPTGLCMNFKLVGGCIFLPQGSWYYEKKED